LDLLTSKKPSQYKTMNPSHSSSKTKRIAQQEKIQKIEECLSQPEVNLWRLRELCLTEGGLMTSELRRKSWYKLVGIDPTNNSNSDNITNKIDQVDSNDSNTSNNTSNTLDDKKRNLENSFTEDTELISRDVGRAVYFRYPITEATKSRNESRKTMLTQIIVSTISNRMDDEYSNGQNGHDDGEKEKGGRLNYYQGFHDVASVIFVNMPQQPELASSILQRIAHSHLRDTMMEDFSYVSSLLEIVFYPLLQIIDEELHDYLILRELGPTVFLTWMITLFSHDIHDEEIGSRVFDAIIASHPLMPLYLSLAILTLPENRSKLFGVNRSEPAMLQVVATNLVYGLVCDFGSLEDNRRDHDGNDHDCADDEFSAQDIINYALGFMKRIPPESLLNLAKNYDLGQSEILMKRCESLCLFKPPQTWALANTYHQTENDKMIETFNTNMEKAEVSHSLSSSSSLMEFPNAKIASGVSSIMYDGEDNNYSCFDLNSAKNHAVVQKFGAFVQNTINYTKNAKTKIMV
jgi:hypothetical protein